MAQDLTVFGMVGSLRKESFNWKLMRRAGVIAPQGITFDVFSYLGALPHFSQEREGELTPPAVLDFRARIAAADAVLVATPEYNHSMPGVLKNALDWASRPAGESVLDGMPAGTIGASPGRFGAARAQADVRKVLTAIGAEVLDRDLAITRAHEAFDPEGGFIDPENETLLAAQIAALIELAGEPGPAETDDSAEYSRECQRLAAAG